MKSNHRKMISRDYYDSVIIEDLNGEDDDNNPNA